MGCSCIKHNLIENEYKVTEENIREKSNSKETNDKKENNNIIINNNYNINNDNDNNNDNKNEIFRSGKKSNNQSSIKSNDDYFNLLKSSNLNQTKNKDINTNNINSINNNINTNKSTENEYLANNLFNKRVFELINKVRLNPVEYANYVLENLKNICIENKEELNKKTEMKEIKQITVFKKKVKVRLYKGEEGFLETAQLLQKIPSMEPLKFNENIVIPISDSFKDSVNFDLMKNKINSSNINLFFKGNIKNPEIAVLLMIVDDSEFSEKKKRNALLNKEFQYIGIDSKFIGKNFVSHFSFSK